MLEVEIKAFLTMLPQNSRNSENSENSANMIKSVEKAAVRIGFSKGDILEEKDIYFNGCDRNFMKTDEALRLRTCRNLTRGAEETFITYKGPKLDKRSSARTEHEAGIKNFTAMEAILISLGYSKAFTVEKQRQIWTLDNSDKLKASDISEKPSAAHNSDDLSVITLCIDSVKGLGSYIELETLIISEEGREAAVDRLLALLDSFGIPRENMTRKSYLELLLLQSKL